jgi:hypothetical protein
MHIAAKALTPLKNVQLSADESKMLAWIRAASWEPQTDAREPIPYTAKVPEFFGGARLYRVQAAAGLGGSQGLLDLFIKKLEYQGVITKQELYPVTVKGSARFLSLKKADLENLGVGQDDEDE